MFIFLALLFFEASVAQTETEDWSIVSESVTYNNLELSYCDEDSNGFITFTVESLEEEVIENAGIEDSYYLEQILISSSSGIWAINSPSNNPYLYQTCENISTYDIAVDSNQDIYVTGLLRVFDDCTLQGFNVSSWGRNALSFDDLDHLYTGFGNGSFVLRTEVVSEDTPISSALWHDFGSGSSGGDFVLFNNKLYVAWKLNGYRLYEVTVDADRNYISHIDLGEIPDKTYGLAKELNQIYGVTPDKLYRINLDDFTFTDIIENPDPEIEWYGAAGLHEAVNFETSLHLTQNQAELNANRLIGEWTNFVEGGQVIYARVENILTHEYDIFEIMINIYDYPDVNEPLSLHECYTDVFNVFDLNEVSTQMQNDYSQNLKFTYYLLNPETDDSAVPLDIYFQSTYHNQGIYVKVENLDGGCYYIYNFRLINNLVPSVLSLSSQQYPLELTNCYLDSSTNGYFDLSEIDDVINLGGGDVEVTYYLSYIDADSGLNPISNQYYLQTENEEIFARVTNQSGCYAISNFYIDYDCIRNNPSTEFIVFPKFMTPNEDGENDFWNVSGISEKLRRESVVSIYNRYGKHLISFKPYSIPGWDGIVNGKAMPTSDYWVVFKTNTGYLKTGHFTLKR